MDQNADKPNDTETQKVTFSKDYFHYYHMTQQQWRLFDAPGYGLH